jgi:effector-binding domain-containing protein
MLLLSRMAPFAVAAVLAFAGPGVAQPQSPAGPLPPAPTQSADSFGEEVVLPGRPMLYMQGTATWDSGFETLVDAFKSVYAFLGRQGLKAAGFPLTIYTSTDDIGFRFRAGVPIAEEPKDPPRGDIAVDKAPAGKALKFVHRGSYDSMDTTYDAITNYLDEKRLDAQDLFIEEYVTDPVSTADDDLVVNILVPIR